MRQLLFLTVVLAALPLLTGCNLSHAQAAKPDRVLWNEEDAAQQLANLKQANDSRFTALDERLDSLEKTVSGQISRLDERLTASSDRLSKIDRQELFAKLDSEAVASAREAQEADRRNPTFPAPVSSGPELPLCITIHGVDWDLQSLLKTWCKADTQWTWPGDHDAFPLATLRRHLAEPEHAVTGIESVPDSLLPEIHEAMHEMELAQVQKPQAAEPSPAPTKAVTVSSLPEIVLNARPANPCPNGLCPRPNSSSVQSKSSNLPVIVPNPSGPHRQTSQTFTSSTTRTRPGLFRHLTAPVRWVTSGLNRRSRQSRHCR